MEAKAPWGVDGKRVGSEANLEISQAKDWLFEMFW